MAEKLKAFLQNEKVKIIGSKIFSRKTIIGALVILVVATTLRIGFLFMFEVQGTVQKIDGSKITVASFLRTTTVDVGSYPITANEIQAGDEIEITKNLSGQVISVKDESRRHMIGRGDINNSSEKDSRVNDKNNTRGKH